MTSLNRYLDAAILKPELTREECVAAIQECIRLKTYSVCVRPCDIPLAQEHCKGSETAVCVVLGFPHGDQLPATKAAEAAEYIRLGVEEIDMVANYGRARSGDWEAVQADIAGVASLTRPAGVLLKVIFEIAHLEADAIKKLIEICIEAGADFVKTSTGFNGEGAKEADVQRMLDTAAGRIRVKPSGGIRDARRAQNFIDMGAQRLGVSWSTAEAICRGKPESSSNGY
jgi:deoxyribose-phosphate aldolase